MKNTKRFSLALVAVIALISATSAQAAGFKIIVNSGIHVDSMPKKALSDLFMKRTAKWENGSAAVPVDNAGPIREDFSRTVHGRAAAAIKSYWNQQIFSGREVPPVEKQNDAEVLAFVRSTAGAVGYVSENAPTDGVRVVQVQQ